MKRYSVTNIVIFLICILLFAIPSYADNTDNRDDLADQLEDLGIYEQDTVIYDYDLASPSEATPRGTVIYSPQVNITDLGYGRIQVDALTVTRTPSAKIASTIYLRDLDDIIAGPYAYGETNEKPANSSLTELQTRAIFTNIPSGRYMAQVMHTATEDGTGATESVNTRTAFLNFRNDHAPYKTADVFYNTNLTRGETPEIRDLLDSKGYSVNHGGNPLPKTLFTSFSKCNIIHYLGHGAPGFLAAKMGSVSAKEIEANVTSVPADFIYLEACQAAQASSTYGKVDDTLYNLGAKCTLAFNDTISASTDTNGIHFFSTQLFHYIYNEHKDVQSAVILAISDLCDESGSCCGARSYHLNGNWTYQ